MAYWLLKTEPGEYSFSDLENDRTTTWSGVTNPLALKHLRGMKKGDLALIYHTGAEKMIVGIAEISRASYAEAKSRDPRLVVVDITAKEKLSHPVTLSVVKAKKQFAALELVRLPRLSVMPVNKELWNFVTQQSQRSSAHNKGGET